MKVFICWQNDNTVLGIATSEASARYMCSEFGDSYFPVNTDEPHRGYEETTEKCIYRVKEGFLPYQDCIEKGYRFYRLNGKDN